MKKFLFVKIRNFVIAVFHSAVAGVKSKEAFDPSKKRFILNKLFYEKLDKESFFIIESAIDDSQFIFSGEYFYKEIKEENIEILPEHHPYMDGIIDDGEIKAIIISISSIIKNGFKVIEFDRDFLQSLFKRVDKEESSQTEDTESENIKDNKRELNKDFTQKIENGKETDKDISEEEIFDEEEKKKIFNEIEKIIDGLKIKDYEKASLKYQPSGSSFLRMLFILYIFLIFIATTSFAGVYFYNAKKRTKVITEITTTGALETIIIKELQRKQEQEKKKLEEQLSSVKSALEKIQKEKEEFLKNQDKILKEKEKEIYKKFQDQLKRTEELFKQKSISEEEYRKRMEEIQASYEAERKKAYAEAEKIKKEYLAKLDEKQKELKKQEEQFNKLLSQKSKQLKKLQKEKEAITAKLKESKEREQKLQQEISKLQSLALEKIALNGLLNSFYKDIDLSLRRKDYEKALKSLDKLEKFILGDKRAVVLSDTEKMNNIIIIADLKKYVNEKLIQESKLKEKNKLIADGDSLYLKGRYTDAYNKYAEAMINYDVLTGKESEVITKMKNIITTNYELTKNKNLKQKAKELYDKITQAYSNKNYNYALSLIKMYITKYPAVDYIEDVINIKFKINEMQKKENLNLLAKKTFNKAYSLYLNGEYAGSKNQLYKILLNYPGTDYTEKAYELINIIDKEIEQAYKSSAIKTEIKTEQKTTFKIVGRVSLIFAKYILFFITDEKIELKKDDQVKVYRLEGGKYKFIATLKVIEFKNGYGKGIIIVKEEKIKIGDYIIVSTSD